MTRSSQPESFTLLNEELESSFGWLYLGGFELITIYYFERRMSDPVETSKQGHELLVGLTTLDNCIYKRHPLMQGNIICVIDLLNHKCCARCYINSIIIFEVYGVGLVTKILVSLRHTKQIRTRLGRLIEKRRRIARKETLKEANLLWSVRPLSVGSDINCSMNMKVEVEPYWVLHNTYSWQLLSYGWCLECCQQSLIIDWMGRSGVRLFRLRCTFLPQASTAYLTLYLEDPAMSPSLG
jgi:hypothetical protein